LETDAYSALTLRSAGRGSVRSAAPIAVIAMEFFMHDVYFVLLALGVFVLLAVAVKGAEKL
jgi:hypothetical protein